MAAHALCGSTLWNVRPHAPRAVKETTLASVEAGAATAEMSAARERAEALFEALGAPVPRRNGDVYHLCETFAALLVLSDAEVAQVVALAMAQTLDSGGPAVEAVLHACGTDLSVYWQPDEAFFSLLRDKPVINALVASIGGLALAETCAADPAKAQKTVLANRIAGEGCAPHPGWRPGWMQVPPTRHIDGAACGPADAWDRIAGLFEADTEENSGLDPDACDATAA
jgi:ParB family chromosome partitioning protein